jgi:hypothetical protein
MPEVPIIATLFGGEWKEHPRFNQILMKQLLTTYYLYPTHIKISGDPNATRSITIAGCLPANAYYSKI